MNVNSEGLELIKSFEGCRLRSYTDSVGIWTIGYGHIQEVYPGEEITQEQANQFLKDDLIKFEDGVTRLVTSQINENQFSALVSFAFNLGLGNLGKSTLLKYVNTGEFDKAADEFVKWANAGGATSPGLLRRREAERTLFIL